jgi:hypothetical protein
MTAATPTAAPQPRDDVPTLAAIAILGMMISTVAHEAVGHGGMCLATGGQITRLTSVYFHCSPQTTLDTIGGPLGNLAAGVIALFACRFVPARFARTRLLLIFVTAFSLFWEGGYLMHAMLKRDGDWFFAARDVLGEAGETGWRIGGGVLGLLLDVACVTITARALRPYANGEGRAQRIARWVWLIAAATSVAAAGVYPDRDALKQAALEIGGASLPLLILAPKAGRETAAPQMTRSWPWIAAAVVLFAVFVWTMGRGIPA